MEQTTSAQSANQTTEGFWLSSLTLYLWWDSGARVGQSGRKSDEKLSGMSVVSVLLGVQRVRGHVGDGDLQHHHSLV